MANPARQGLTVISSRRTWFYKRGFPVLWFGIIGIASGVGFLAVKPAQIAFLLPLALMALVGYLFMRKLIFDLADEVRDAGDSLVVRKDGQEERIPLANVMNVSSSQLTNPPRVTLRLVRPGRFGKEIHFIPLASRSFNPFAPNAVAEALVERAYAARTQSAR